MALLGKLTLTEASQMEFGLEVFGTVEKPTDIRLVIEGSEYDVVCHCTNDKGNITAHIPKLKNILPAGVYEAKLECIIDGKIFTPLRESIEFEPLVEFDVSKKKVESIKEGVKVKVKTSVVSEEKKVSKRDATIEKILSEGYEIVSMNNFDVVKKDGYYYGLLGESSVVMSKEACGTLSDLVETLSKD